jgi:hypothetical protein
LSSKKEREIFDPCLQGKVPDYSASLKNENELFDLFLMEAKPPIATVVDIDLLKMGNMLKNSLDCLYKSGLDHIDLSVFGLVIEGIT